MSLKEELTKTIDQAEWAWLKSHLERDALILVGVTLELSQIGVEIAENQVAKIQTYLSDGSLSKPTLIQIKTWDQVPEKKFKVVIVRPFVLIQEVA